jgi:L-arabinose isomerase
MVFKMNEKCAETKQSSNARIGVFGVGYDKYWEQFDGLYDEMLQKQEKFIRKIPASGIDVTDFGVIDSPRKAYEVVKKLECANLDLVFCDMLTYATSGTFGIIVKTLSIPVVLVALQPLKALDYSNGSTYMQLMNDDFCAVPEFAGVTIRMGKKVPEVIIG